MKKNTLFSTILLSALVILLSLSITSCNNSDDDNGGNGTINEKLLLSKKIDGNNIEDFYYDNYNRIIKYSLTEKNSSGYSKITKDYTFTYSANNNLNWPESSIQNQIISYGVGEQAMIITKTDNISYSVRDNIANITTERFVNGESVDTFSESMKIDEKGCPIEFSDSDGIYTFKYDKNLNMIEKNLQKSTPELGLKESYEYNLSKYDAKKEINGAYWFLYLQLDFKGSNAIIKKSTLWGNSEITNSAPIKIIYNKAGYISDEENRATDNIIYTKYIYTKAK